MCKIPKWLLIWSKLFIFVCLFDFWIYGLPKQLRLALNLWSSCLHHPSAEITGACYHTQLNCSFLKINFRSGLEGSNVSLFKLFCEILIRYLHQFTLPQVACLSSHIFTNAWILVIWGFEKLVWFSIWV
jgi:hypothetical protein